MFLCAGEITRVFGKHMLEYLKNLCQGHLDYLPRLSTDLLIRIIRYLSLEDVSRLACVSKQFQKVSHCISLFTLSFDSVI